MTAGRLRPAHVEWVADRLTVRDWQIMEGVNTLRLLTGQQIERLYFADLKTGRSRIASRSRVLHRLVAWRALVPLPRRIGGAGRGSTTLAFALDSDGQRLVRQRLIGDDRPPRVRRPGTPGERTVRHIMAVSECYVALMVLSRTKGFTIVAIQPELSPLLRAREIAR
ncbi:MAG: replication-relaxation family protein [Streptosporangiaceae bacterium]